MRKLFYYLLYLFQRDPKYRKVYFYQKLDTLLLAYLNNFEIKAIEKDQNQLGWLVVFDDDTKIYFHSTPHNWIYSGFMIFSNGKRLDWNEKRPSYRTMYKIKKSIKRYEKIKNNPDNSDCSEYLPLKLVRKNKLNKLK